MTLITLPIEILAEILLCTCSPPTVLAVSRSCSSLYRFLVHNPAASFIWRGVRKSCAPVPLPDPGDLWKKSEADYAAFVFGGGVCEVCQEKTRAMYSSFATRIRLCGSWHCRRKLLDEHLTNATTVFQGRLRESLWIPHVESNLCFCPSTQVIRTWPHTDSILLRKTDLDRFLRDLTIYYSAEEHPLTHEEADTNRELVVKRCNAAVQKLPAIMQLSVQLTEWKAAYDREYKKIKQYNHSWTVVLAARVGWDLTDLVASQTYGSLQRRKNSLLEKLMPNDVPPRVRAVIESELVAIQSRHTRKKAEATYKEKLTDIKKIYNDMRCATLKGVASSDPLIVPPMSVFCTLPSVRSLKGSPDPNTVPSKDTPPESGIKSSPLALSLIMSDIRAWLVPVRKHLMGLLGYQNGWQSASTLILHPLERVTARFFCRDCGQGVVGHAYRRERCLDLKGVCSHVCVKRGKRQEAAGDGEVNGQGKSKGKNKNKKGGKVPDWKVELFEKDEKAIRLIKIILHMGVLSDKSPGTKALLKDMNIRCMSCKGWIVMDFETAIGHAHRHERMQPKVLHGSTPIRFEVPKKEVPNERLAFERGTCELLLGPSYRGRRLCKMTNYGCRHCLLVQGWNVAGDPITVNGKGVSMMTFDGLRSHVGEKHGIRDISDEDVFCYSSIEKEE